MSDQRTNIEGILGSILRGSAKILGCISANLVILNKRTRQAHVRVGTIAEKREEVSEIEELVGDALQSIVFPFSAIDKSLVYASWKDARIYETSSLLELIGSALPHEIITQVVDMIGDQRFICVPVRCGRSSLGVMIFTKEDLRPFGLQRREILLRYAQRIGEIIENEWRGRGSQTVLGDERPSPNLAASYLLFDSTGETVGFSPARNSSSSDSAGAEGANLEALRPALARHVSGYLGQDREQPLNVELADDAIVGADDQVVRHSAELSRLMIGGDEHILCSVHEFDPKPRVQPGQSQLLQFALGDTAPALLVDSRFSITSCNEATERLLGYKPDELLHRPISVLFREARDVPAILNHQLLFLSDGYFEDVTIVRHKSGRMFPGKIEALLLADESNQVIGYLVLIHDHSDLVSDSRDEDSVSHLMRMERLATMGEMAAQLAHEIRNPLVSVGATLEMLTREDNRGRDNWEILKVLAKEVTRADMILKDYLSLARRRNVMVSSVVLTEVVEDARQLLEGAQATDGKKITSDIAQGLHVLADYDGLRHVVHNLLINALEATPPGSDIECHASAFDGNVIVHIDDNGAGLSCSSNECFTPFYSTKANGTGLGLAVCEKIVRSYAGTISLKNRREGGCRASVVLPQGNAR